MVTKRSHLPAGSAPHAHRGGGMKARPLEAAVGKPGHAGRSGHASLSGPSSRTKAEGMAGTGAFVSGVLGAALLAAALLLPPGEARAEAECGAGNLPVLTCSNAAYSDGIFYRNTNALNSATGNTVHVTGSSTATTTITAGSIQAVGVSLRNIFTGGSITLNVGGETGGTAHVVHIVQGTNTRTQDDRNNGVYVSQQRSSVPTMVNVRSGVTIGTSSTPMKRHGIYMRLNPLGGAGAGVIDNAAPIFAAKQGIRLHREVAGTTQATTITNRGAISAGVGNAADTSAYRDQPNGIVMLYDVGGSGPATITNTGDITVSGAYIGILMDYRGTGAAEINNEGAIAATMGRGIQFDYNGAGTLTNSGAISAATFGLRLNKRTGGGAVALTNSGRVTVTADAAAGVGHALWLEEAAAVTGGAVTITNSGVLSSKNHALFAEMSAANAAALVLTNTGAIASEDGDGIRIERGVEGDVTVTNSGAVSGRDYGIYVGKAARFDFDQEAGTISGRTGVYAEVSKASAMGDMRSMDSDGNHVPAIDIDWTGGSIARGTAENDVGRFRAASATQVLTFDQESATGKAVAETVRWGAPAGIEAHALSWRDVAEEVAKGDDPDAIADNTAQMAAVPTGATAGDNAYVAQFKAALRNTDLDVAAVITAIGSTATTAAEVTDAEIVTYLRTNNAATRTLLRNVLAQGLSDAEKAVLRAVAAGDSAGLTAALDDADAGFSNAYKTAVRALLDRYNLDDVRVNVTAGSIASRGDGIRAYYATPHANNGAIAVTVGNGATVSGGVHGIHVSGAGLAAGGSGRRAQTVTVNGTVMGGTGAGVYLTGGGTVTVGTTGRVGATSGDGIRADGGDLSVSVTGMVEGDLRATDGALTFASLAGSQVTGTVHNPVGPLTVAGSIGRLLYTDGGTVTVAPSGRLTGVEGEVIRSAGDLSVSVAGMVEGDIRAMGDGALTFASMAGSRVTGTVHDPVGPLTVAGSIGRLLYTDGGTVTVAPSGRLTGVEGEAIRSEAGDLSVSVAGTVMDDIRGSGDGDLTAMVMGTVDGDILGLSDGDHVVTVPVGGTVTGTVHLAGSTVTVGGTVGRVTLENRGMVTVAPTGRVTGIPGGHGVKVGAGSTVTNRGTIAGKIGIQAGAGSTVVNYDTVRSTDGIDGIAFDFPEDGAPHTLEVKRGQVHEGKIKGLTKAGGDIVDLLDIDANDFPMFTFVDKNGRPLTAGNCPEFRLPSGFTQAADCSLIPRFNTEDTTAFALTDDMLSDLTGSIHAAVVGTGRPASPREGTPARGHVWATPFGGVRTQDGTDTLAAGTHSFGGGLLGAGWGGPALHVGGFLGGSTGRLDVAHRQDVDMQTVFGGVYAQQARGDVRLDARLLVGHMKHDSTRRVSRGTANAEYTSTFFSPEVGVATRLPVTATLHATPRLQVRYAGLFTEGFRERGRGVHWDLQFAERTVQILEVRGAVGVPIPLAGGGRLEPRVGLEGRWLLAGEPVEAADGAVRLAAGGDTSVGTGTAGFRMTLPVAEATTLVGNFDGALTTEHAWRATGYLGLTYSF